VLGRVVSVSIEPAGLLATFEYDTDINPKANLVFQQVQKGTMRGFSVGFLPKSWVTDYSPPEHIDALPEGPREALKSGRAFVVYTSAELIEISQVPIPSNPDALVGASVKSARLQELKQLEESTMDKKPEAAAVEEKAAELKAGPDIEALVKTAVSEAMAPVLEALAKLAAPAAEKSPEPAPVNEALAKLASMTDSQLDNLLTNMTSDERKALLALTL